MRVPSVSRNDDTVIIVVYIYFVTYFLYCCDQNIYIFSAPPVKIISCIQAKLLPGLTDYKCPLVCMGVPQGLQPGGIPSPVGAHPIRTSVPQMPLKPHNQPWSGLVLTDAETE